MRSRLRALALLGGLAASACAARPPAPDPVAPAFEQRLYALGALHVNVKIPNAPPGRKPAIVSSFGAPEPLLARGFVLADFEVDWGFVARQTGTPLPPPEPEPPAQPPAGQVGVWLLASPRPGIIGRSYFQLIGASAAHNVPAVVDLLERLPEVDPQRPLLMLAGREDRPMPFACVKSTADAFAHAYAQAGVPERFELRAFSGEGHHLGPQAEELALQWWERWLLHP